MTLDDVPDLSEETRWIDSWEKWLEKHSFPMPSSLVIGTNIIKRFKLPWVPNNRAHSVITMGVGAPAYFEDGRPLTDDGGQFLFYCDAALHRQALDHFDAMALDAWTSVGFSYGYAFTYQLRGAIDPLGFCFGLPRRGDMSDFNEARARWATFRRRTPEGCRFSAWMDKQQGNPASELVPGPSYSERLRDVFPLNYLVASHLALTVGSSSLGEWIEQDSSRGTLRQLADGLWCWAVDEIGIPAVRCSLEPSGLLVAPGGR
ncbi:hypothetical protein [Aquabacterium commune]|uniref:hypothetical protein n=1 Tax=Aquabacterium commune TaxID=70586 RepID=UPI00105F640E|nr:hypothetical protein [Aquabacterium commune]